MDKKGLERYTDYHLSTFGYSIATGLERICEARMKFINNPIPEGTNICPRTKL